MTDENNDGPGVNDETVIRNPNEDEETSGGPSVPTGADDGQDQSGGQGGPSVPTGGQSQSNGPSVPGGGQGQSGGQPAGQDQSGGQGGPSVPGGGQGQGQSDGQGQPSTGGQGGPSIPGGGQAQSTGGQNQPTTGASGGNQPTTGTGGGQAQSAGAAAGTATGSGGGTGLDANVAGALAYLFAPLGGIVMFVVEDDEFVQFHAKQGIVFGVLMFAAWIGLFVFNFVVGMIFDAIGVGALNLLWGLISFLLYPLVGFVGFAAWAFLTYKAYQGDRFQIPLIGGMVA